LLSLLSHGHLSLGRSSPSSLSHLFKLVSKYPSLCVSFSIQLSSILSDVSFYTNRLCLLGPFSRSSATVNATNQLCAPPPSPPGPPAGRVCVILSYFYGFLFLLPVSAVSSPHQAVIIELRLRACNPSTCLHQLQMSPLINPLSL